MKKQTIQLDCPYCHQAIVQTAAWFKRSFSTCPHCQGGLNSRQFETLVKDLEQALDQSIEVMLGEPAAASGCGCDHGCGCHPEEA